MVDPAIDSAMGGHKEFVEVQDGRAWIKPTLERLALKDALGGCGCVNEGITVGSHS